MSPVSKRRRRSGTVKRRPARTRTSDASTSTYSPSRYTPPPPGPHIRPTGHKVVGWSLLGFGLLMIILNYAEEFDLNTSPGPHLEAYFFLGVVIVLSSTWWFGWFDRSKRPGAAR